MAKVKTQLITWRPRRPMQRLMRSACCATELAVICIDMANKFV